ncbi:MAG: CBS domain-containing protein [Nitrospirales bacterium]|nr:CBS domain-containing protein [Nitrospira sp.]MDR4461089.1 CBS domain-containing protein [Nitrospirales bacterium]
MVRVEDLMKQDLASVNCGDLVSLAATLMRVRRIGSVFVKQHGHIVGIITEADIVRKVVSTHRSPEQTTVETIMTAPVITIDQDAPIFEAADLMDRSGIRHLAVTHRYDIVGIVSVRDLLHPVAIDEF